MFLKRSSFVLLYPLSRLIDILLHINSIFVMFDNQGKDIVQCAETLACLLHSGQVDKAGVDYFTGHLTAVAEMGNTWQE